jgi:hypothetical protein
MRWFGGVLAGLVCLVFPADAKPARTTVFSSVRYIEEAGDDLGMEVRIHPGPKPWIDFVLCEGACSQQVRLPIVMRANGFTFTYREALVDQDNHPVPDAVMDFAATYEGRNLVIRQKGALSEKLRPRSKPIALQ